MSNSKPSRNAFYGYTYQENITFFLLAKMDVEREIESIEMEVTEDHNFDDAKIIIRGIEYSFQMKDLEKISFKDLIITVESIFIQRREHKLSKGLNILFFKEIDVINNSEIFGLPVFQKENLFIISASREFISDEIDKIYFQNENRISVIDKFFKNRLDNRNTKLKISLDELPPIQVFNHQLLEDTINVKRNVFEFDKILHIEGKPGVGKSHLVKALAEEYANNILYRFWTSSQDKDKKERLIFYKFLFDFAKKIFSDQKIHSEDEIVEKLANEGRVVIIDGLDHIENYEKDELKSYISFIEKLKEKCRVIVLSRPLETKLNWEKQTLENWNREQTLSYIKQAYKNIDYSISIEIFRITEGYPILVRYFAEHYKIFQKVPDLPELKNLDEFYGQIIKSVKTKSDLKLFISSSSFFMKSELSIFINEPDDLIEYINAYPYLFDIRLNRISLFHDSFNTYLRKQGIDNSKMIQRVNKIVFQSIMNGQKSFLSRFSNFPLNQEMKLKIIQNYSSMDLFEQLMKDAIDFEAIRSFYKQIRESIEEISAEKLDVSDFYNLALIFNIVMRDHVSTDNAFLYTFVKCLLYNGYSEEDITSSEYLFAMLYFVETNNISLFNNFSPSYNTSINNNKFKNEIESEKNYFYAHPQPLKLTKHIKQILNNGLEYESEKVIKDILENTYIHKPKIKTWLPFYKIIHEYMEGDDGLGVVLLKEILPKYRIRPVIAKEILSNVKYKFATFGIGKESNKYRNFLLREFIMNYRGIGSFAMQIEILNYMRLALDEERKIDLKNISVFWTMYQERKDYTVTNLDVALTAFEKIKMITEEESFDILKFTQSMSEKGIGHLFNSYIELHSPEILTKILEKNTINDLQIHWFDLPAKFIDLLPDTVFSYEMNKIIRQGSYFKTIDFDEIKNVFKSNYRDELVIMIKALNYIVKISKSSPMIGELKETELPIEIQIEKDKLEYDDSSAYRYSKGFLDSKDLDFIKEKDLSIKELAGLSDGYYSVFSDLKIYSIFPDEELRKNIRDIFYNALLCKPKDSSLFAYPFYFVGNLPRFLIDLEVKEDFHNLYRSFKKFLELSLLIDRKS